MKPIIVIATSIIVLCGWNEPAQAWDPHGHEVVGAIADALLAGAQEDKVKALLGYDLRTASKWADCVRSVVKVGDQFVYTKDPKHPEYTKDCGAFETPDEIDRMQDYARRNWDGCLPDFASCHSRYHFADIALEREAYDSSGVGSSPRDVVHAMEAALSVLEGGSAPAPFSIKDKKEALLLLAHFTGDVHQPLHVGAVYLDVSGHVVDPKEMGFDMKMSTAGGNAIHFAGGNLHAAWDHVDPAPSDAETASLVEQARAAAPTAGVVEHWPEQWAAESVLVAHEAFRGLAFAYSAPTKWGPQWVATSWEDNYDATRRSLQLRQLSKAGARLAATINALPPLAP